MAPAGKDRDRKSDLPEDKSWADMFYRLHSFYDSISSARTIPLHRSNLDPSLQRWIQKQRLSYSRFLRNPPKKPSDSYLKRWESLKSIGFPFTAKEDEWDAKFHQLLQHRNQYGHLNLNVTSPTSTQQVHSTESSIKEHQALERWVELQRIYKGKKNQSMETPLTDEREKRLTEIGFDWSAVYRRDYFYKIPWLRQFQHLTSLIATYRNNNNPLSPSLLQEYPSLMRWIKRQHKEKHILSEEKLKLLHGIDFFTDSTFAAPKSYGKWDVMFQELKNFYLQHGHCRVPQNYITDVEHGKPTRKLGQWVRSQRTQFRQYEKGFSTPLNAYRINLLNGVDFEWRVYQKRERNNRTLIYSSNNENNEQDVSKSESNEMIRLLKDFHSKHGHIFVPTSYTSNASVPSTNDNLSSLSLWLLKKRLAYHKQHHPREGDELNLDSMKIASLSMTERNLLKEGRDLYVSKDEIQALNELDFVWSLEDAKWWETYHKLESSQMRGLPRDVQVKLSKHMLVSRSRQTQVEDVKQPSSITAVENEVPSNPSVNAIAVDAGINNETKNKSLSIAYEKNDHPQDRDDAEDTSIDLLMTPAQQKWYKMFETLKKVRSYDSIADPLLEEWIQEQRQKYWKKQMLQRIAEHPKQNVNGRTKNHPVHDTQDLTDEEILALDSISFPWNNETSKTIM